MGGMLRTLAFLVLLWLVAAAAQGQTNLLTLDIGDGARRGRVEIARDAIVDTSSGDTLSVQQLAARVGDSRIVLVGEQHTDAAYHAVQLRVLEALHAAGIPLLIGVEMFPAGRERVLDAWTRGELEEADFLAQSDWYNVWGYDWRYYREIFLFARARSIPIAGLRADDEDAPPEIAVDLDSADHETLLRAFFEVDSPVHGGMSASQFASLFAAQARRDAAMAQNLGRAMQRYPDRTALVLAGTGHVVYELGIVRQLPEAQRLSATTIVPVPVASDTKSSSVTGAIGDLAWGMPESEFPAYPELGILTTQTAGGLHVIYVEPDSSAAFAGLAAGDVLTRYAGRPLAERSDLGRSLSSNRWGDEVVIELERDDELREIAVALRRRTGD